MNTLKLIVILAATITVGNVTMGQVGMASINNSIDNVKNVEKPEVGKPMPDFTLDNITNYKTTKASLKDFRGKWLILDLWFKGCAVCIKSFPHLNILHEKFKDKVQFMLVGDISKDVGGNAIIETYENVSEIQKLKLACAFDSTIIQKYQIHSFPYVYIIDPNGILVAITDGRDITNDKIEKLTDGKSVTFFPKEREKFISGINNSNPKDSDSLILFQSTLSKYTNQDFFLPPIDYQLTNQFKRKGFKIAGVALPFLYNLAYFGKHHWTMGDSLYEKVHRQPVLNIKDSSLFDWNDRIIKGLYNYSLDMPPSKATKENIMEYIQNDLKKYFGYTATIEKRFVPVWVIISEKDALEKLRSKSTVTSFKGDETCLILKNYNWSKVPYLLVRYMKEPNLITVFDETNLTGEIDINITAFMSDFDQVRKELRKNGLDIIKKEKEMKVLVISDLNN
ncbi:TlpA family protein disulfide reductase [Chitinophaga niabensis]|uniref:Peroxiredoxin n=1 Tax=Chitinophaga niabensis TaxID=536979 RepID=A0A1N6KAT2_9BACT|nr:TlpA disulfide reductase family protein [Chitinophaga niabensis]SIO53658.1 Peroxiredoxin [Chitinophaga niabensis]